ncbi:CRISPR-associated endoribonuclease Cas6 [Desulfuribacillus stibiiarsenatis]|uniref:CRISPR-associated endoribonuclease Cas6 n=1 Tax=Desulfuribacillus stibiiarsenatis TaxID=1390249 RepID=A0A1E5L4J2_9FIRM|nr:CRISPR-associated endoribonuclease Cas6 [Desulfuribacillus stibiiarsenatis]OEH84879.1 CRISPR-associated endoribonuclease Cas6 [Desulfuribacillus stibiiarsenatis]
MRFSITYQVSEMPTHYRMKIYSLIKEAVKRGAPDYYLKIFEEQRKEIKPLCFGTYLKEFKIEDKKIHLKEITITISSTMEFAIHAFNGFRELHSYEIEGVELKQTKIQLLKEADIVSGEVYFTTISPILIENRMGKPLSPAHPEYENELNYYANLQLKQMAGRELYKPIRFTPIKMKKTVIKESNQLFRQTHNEESLFYTAYRGDFKLQGHPEDLKILYQFGLGKRTAYFGLLEYRREGA